MVTKAPDTGTPQLSRKLELYRKAQTFGRNASFVANVILTGHSKPITKLAGLIALLEAGHEVSPAPFCLDRLWIDGQGNYFYSALEKGLDALGWVDNDPEEGGSLSPAGYVG